MPAASDRLNELGTVARQKAFASTKCHFGLDTLSWRRSAGAQFYTETSNLRRARNDFGNVILSAKRTAKSRATAASATALRYGQASHYDCGAHVR